MNYDQARERMGEDGKGTGLWDWTSKNDGVIRPAGPCGGGCDHHTREEAERHFYDYSLARVREFTLQGQQLECNVCGDWTAKGLDTPGLNLYSFRAMLCDKHRNREELQKLFPFKPVIALIHS